MSRWIIKMLLNGAALLLISNWFHSIYVANFTVALWAILILGMVNTVIRPILLFFTFPLQVLTIGLFWFVINAVTFALTAYFIDGFEVGPWPDNIGTVIVAAALMSIFGYLIEVVVGTRKEKR
ncbi:MULTISPECIES: phage holin family protein [Brevibacillus]|uniref:phage holin family protein n=1 Tax=Brevibacillus TaxID=55080 RepID=UPI0007D89A98|nr:MULTISPECIES: phage holin family protein [Bacillales]MBH0328341.1 membrane protein [Brevibacillus brevis]NQF13233.1 phage holin family protein [Brevibacillus sp. HB1.3]NRR03411.1 phage holin family protein [Brevibacillus sp. RS1.1]NRS49340.1 phage holin family protein [Brevibacillus sp. HB2.2]TQR32513.1 phage holin family protein [Lysinibacillus sp. SDF0063]